MPTPALRVLLTDLDQQTHAGRCRTVAGLAVAHRDDPTADPAAFAGLLDGLEAQSHYHAGLVTLAARITGDAGRLHRLTRHPSRTVARAAAAALPLGNLALDEAVAIYLEAPAAQRRTVRRRLAAAGREDVVDTLIVDGGLADRERAALLPAASESVVRAQLEDLGGLLTGVARLAERHPGPVLDLLATQNSEPVRERDWWWTKLGPALPVLARLAPDRLLAVLEACGDGLPSVMHRRLGTLIRHDPARVAALVLATPYGTGWELDRGLLRGARRFSEADQHRLARYLREVDSSWGIDEERVAAFLDALPPSRRATTFAAAYQGVSLAERELNSALLLALPHPVRHAQARRMLGLRGVADDAARRSWLSSHLPAAEAAERLAPVTRSSLADERAGAHGARLRAAGLDRDPVALSHALTRLTELRNEQDPVRAMAATTLAGIPAHTLVAADLTPLTDFTLEVVTARDTSPGTLQGLVTTWWGIALTALAASRDELAGRDEVAGKALTMLLDLHEPRGSLTIPSLTRLPHGRERQVVDALLPRVQAGLRRDEPQLLFTLCRALGDRAGNHPDLQQLLEGALRTRNPDVLRTATDLWLADPRTRAGRVETALRLDESLATLSVVQDVLGRSRQDLLDVLWRPKPLKGRLWDKRLRFVPVLAGPFGRWLPRQVAGYAAALGDLLATPDTPTWTRAGVVRTLGRLPEIGWAALHTHLASPDVAVQEAALAALAHTDRPGEALPLLLGVRSGDRVRVALYAAGRCVRDLPEAQAWPLLLAVLDDPQAKVTARKEAVRLLGAMRAGEAVDRVVGLGLAEDTHRDVRLAAGRAVLSHLDDPRAWQVLERVAGSGPDGALAVLRAQPRQLAQRHRDAYGALVARHARVPGLEAVTARHAWVPWLPDAGTLLTGMVRDLSWPTWRGTLLEVRSLLREGLGWPEVTAAVQAMADAAEPPEGQTDDDGAPRDLPTRQRLAGLVDSVTGWPEPERRRHADRIRRLAALLATRPDCATPALQAAARAVDWAAPGADLPALVRTVDDPLRCAEQREAVTDALSQHPADPSPALAEATTTLVSDGSATAGSAALAIVSWAGERTGWSPPWRPLLTELRRHPVPAVAGWARDLTTSPE